VTIDGTQARGSTLGHAVEPLPGSKTVDTLALPHRLFTAPPATVALCSDLTITVQHGQKVMVAEMPARMLDAPRPRIYPVSEAPKA
jgi:hypothetical protein